MSLRHRNSTFKGTKKGKGKGVWAIQQKRAKKQSNKKTAALFKCPFLLCTEHKNRVCCLYNPGRAALYNGLCPLASVTCRVRTWPWQALPATGPPLYFAPLLFFSLLHFHSFTFTSLLSFSHSLTCTPYTSLSHITYSQYHARIPHRNVLFSHISHRSLNHHMLILTTRN